jgi:hypothetical protein
LRTCLEIVPRRQGRFFYPCNIESFKSFLPDLDFYGLAAEQPPDERENSRLARRSE